MANINRTVESREDFQRICPAILYNFEIGNCEYSDLSGKLPQYQSTRLI